MSETHGLPILSLTTALGAGLLIGLLYERRKQDDPGIAAGLRTHTLAALAGAIALWLGMPVFVVMLVLIGAFAALAQLSRDLFSQIIESWVRGLFGVVNAIVKPVAVFLSIPAIILTLGLFTLVVNAFMLWLTSWLSGHLGLDFSIDAFWWDAVLGGIVITIVSMILNSIVPDGT